MRWSLEHRHTDTDMPNVFVKWREQPKQKKKLNKKYLLGPCSKTIYYVYVCNV